MEASKDADVSGEVTGEVPEALKAHQKWVEKMFRAGLETMCLEHLKDDYFILAPHPLEEITREMLQLHDESPLEECWEMWGMGVFVYSDYVRSGMGSALDVPEHFYSSMAAMVKRLLRTVKDATYTLREATDAFVLSRPHDEDREMKDHQLQTAHRAAEDVLQQFQSSGAPEAWQLPQSHHHSHLLQQLRLLEEQVQSSYEMRAVEAQEEVAAKALSEHMLSFKPWDQPDADASTAMGETGSFFRATATTFDTARDTGFTFRSHSPVFEAKAPGEMLEIILAEHQLPEAMQKELDDFVEDLTARRNEAERQIGILSVMRKTSAFRHDADPFRAEALGI